MTNDRFREQLSIDFAHMTIKDIEELEILMRRKGYRRYYHKGLKKTIKDNPSQAQLDGAWDWLKGGYTEQEYHERNVKVLDEDSISMRVKGKKKRQIRNRLTGRIEGWEE